jgi:serine/threonine-protein kinase
MTQVHAARFQKEVARYGQLNHPHLVKILGGGIDQGRCYLVLELVEGQTLAAAMQRTGPMPHEFVVEQAEGLVDALAYLHRNGLPHGGLKPASILVARDGKMKLGNVGPTWLDDLPLYDRVEMIAESLLYVPLEDTAARPAAGDMFVLGMVLHRMLTGILPHDIRTIGELIEKMGADEPVKIGEIVPGIPRRLQDLVASLLTLDPAARPSAQEARERLRRLRTGEAEPLASAERRPALRAPVSAPRISVRGRIEVSMPIAQPAVERRHPTLMDRLRASVQGFAQRVTGVAVAS